MSGVALQSSGACVQYGALPWRRVAGKIQILLITTQTTRRWIVPKGWPIPGLRPAECAAHEALEEAGVSGEMSAQPMGFFRYEKRRKSGETLPCRIELYALEVTRQRRSWAEKHIRDIRWCSVEEALTLIREPGLARLVSRLAKSLNETETVPARASA